MRNGVTNLRDVKRELSQGLDDPAYAGALRAIRRCRSRADLDALVDTGRWLADALGRATGSKVTRARAAA